MTPPFRSGSAAALRALSQYFQVEIPLPVQANLVHETETKELGVPAGPQDRVIQDEGLVYMDFSKELMERQGYGNYERLDPGLLPNVYLAYRTSLSEGTEVFHGDVRRTMAARRCAGGGSHEDVGRLRRARTHGAARTRSCHIEPD